MAVATAPSKAPAPVIRTSIGKKILVAVSGLLFVGFVFSHMLGNLKFFLGEGEFNGYAEGLRDLLTPLLPRSFFLWGLRSVLFVGLVVHVLLTIQLARQSRAGRESRYAVTKATDSTAASRTMRWGGLAIFAFLFFHLAHFTWGWIHPQYTFVRGAVYENFYASFRGGWGVVFVTLYALSMIAVALHVYHGTWSSMQTLGVMNRRFDKTIRRAATGLAIVIFVGFLSAPVAVLLGAQPYCDQTCAKHIEELKK